MKKNFAALILILLMITNFAYSQDNSKTCKIFTVNLSGSYKGDCKNDVAEGQGEATGLQRYNGSFKDGKPLNVILRDGVYRFAVIIFKQKHHLCRIIFYGAFTFVLYQQYLAKFFKPV